MSNHNRFVVVDETICCYQGSEDVEECGMITSRALNMPFDIPPMPLCLIHAYEFRNWTFDDIIKEFVEVMTDEDMLPNFLENFDDDSE